MKMLDMFCGAGGCSVGYNRAGFDDITGVDINPMPNYPFKFIHADATEYLKDHSHEYEFIHASPPCQAYSITKSIHKTCGHPKLIDDIRLLLKESGKFYVIENVIGSPLSGITLCGVMFGLKVYRHRVFESNVLLLQPSHIKHTEKAVAVGRPVKHGQYMTVAGHFSNVQYARVAMGISWMNTKQLAQAIPPAYTKYIGEQIINAI